MVKRIPDRVQHDIEAYIGFSDTDLPKYAIQVPEIARALHGIPEGGIIADVGCGPCDVATRIGYFARARMIICIDRDLEMLRYAQEKHPDPMLQFVKAEGGFIPLPDGLTDATYANMVLAQQSNRENLFELVAGMAHVTKKGGRVVAVVSNPKTLHLQPGNAIRKFDGEPYSYEGQPHAVTLLDKDNRATDTFTNYYWSVETYVAAFKAAGLQVLGQREVGFSPSIVQRHRIAPEFDFAHVFTLTGARV